MVMAWMTSSVSRPTESCKLTESDMTLMTKLMISSYVSINKGGTPPTFQNVGLVSVLKHRLTCGSEAHMSIQYKKQEMGLGRDRVRLGDIDGDGRLDYCVISNAGNIQ